MMTEDLLPQDKFMYIQANLQSDLKFTNILLTPSRLKVGRDWSKATSWKPEVSVYSYFLNLLGKMDCKMWYGKGRNKGNEHL